MELAFIKLNIKKVKNTSFTFTKLKIILCFVYLYFPISLPIIQKPESYTRLEDKQELELGISNKMYYEDGQVFHIS